MAIVKNPPASVGDAGDVGSIPGLGRPTEVGNGDLLGSSHSRIQGYPQDDGISDKESKKRGEKEA